MNSSTSYSNKLLGFLLVWVVFFVGCAQPRPLVTQVPQRSDRRDLIAVLPVENLSGKKAPLQEIRRSLDRKLRERGIRTVEEETLEGFIKKYRVRYTGGLDRGMARGLREETGANKALITSLDHFNDVYPPKASLSSRLVSMEDALQILWAKTVGLAGDSSPGLLGLGLVKDPDVLLDRAMDQLVESLAGDATGKPKGGIAGESPGEFPPKSVYRDKAIGPNLSLYTVAFSLPSSTGKESSGTASIEVSLSSPSSQIVAVKYGVTGGTATRGNEDYSLAGGTLTFAPGEERKVLEIPLNNDTLHEPDETIVVALTDPENAVLGGISTHTFTIVDDDPLPSVSFSRADQRAEESAGTVTVTVLLSEVSGIPVTIPYSVSGGTASGGGVDYSQGEGTLTFQPGETKKSIDVHIVDDARNEADETVVVFLGAPGNALLGEIPKHTITIVDDDPIPVVSFSLPASNGREGSGRSLPEIFLSGPSGREVTIDYGVTGGNATGGGIDYSLESGTLTFLPGETTKSIGIQLVDDALHEKDETVVVALSKPANADLGEKRDHSFTIVDDDPLPGVSFYRASQRVEEQARVVPAPVILTSVSDEDVSVPYTFTGSATVGADYGVLSANPLIIHAGARSADILVSVGDDTVQEENESITISLGEPENGLLGGIRDHVMTIAANDSRVMAVVPFYNRTLRKNAGGIVALQFANQLGALGVFSVLDPGEVRKKLLDLRVVQEDGLSLADADLVFRRLDADLILTGSVLEYQDYQGPMGRPVVDFSVVVIEKGRRKVIFQSRSSNKGDEEVYLFDWGMVKTADELASQMIRETVRLLVK